MRPNKPDGPDLESSADAKRPELIRVSVLGRPTVALSNGTEVAEVLRQRKRFALLVYLAVNRPHDAHTWSELASVFWPGSDEGRARNSLRQAIHFLRRHLGGSVVVRHHDQSMSIGNDVITTDVDRFLAAAADAQWEQALSFYAGDFMTRFRLPLTDPFDAWVVEERRALKQMAATCARRLADDSEVQGDLNAAAGWWRQAIELSPADADFVVRLRKSLADGVDTVDAIRALERFDRQLWPLSPGQSSVELMSLIERTLRSLSNRPDTTPSGRVARETGDA